MKELLRLVYLVCNIGKALTLFTLRFGCIFSPVEARQIPFTKFVQLAQYWNRFQLQQAILRQWLLAVSSLFSGVERTVKITALVLY